MTGSTQDVDALVDVALHLTWDMCFDGTRVMFKEPETLTLFKVEPLELRILDHAIWDNFWEEELPLDPAEANCVRAMRGGKLGTFHFLKLRGARALEADKLFMKVSPMDFRLSKSFLLLCLLCVCCPFCLPLALFNESSLIDFDAGG